MNFHQGPRYMRGRGLGSLFSGLFRSLRPIASTALNAGKKFLTSDFAKNLGNEALSMGTDALKSIAADVLEGKKSLKDSADQQLYDAKTRIAKTLRGAGRKRKKTKPSCSKKSYKRLKYSLLD